MYRINNLYPFQVWFLTVITAPIIISISLLELEVFGMEEIVRSISFIGAAILFGGGLSLPTLAVYYLSFFLIVRSNLEERTMKGILALVAVFGFVVTFQVIGLDVTEFTMRDIVLPLSYFLGIVGFSTLFRIRKPIKTSSETREDVA
jgi:hypothetical protein